MFLQVPPHAKDSAAELETLSHTMHYQEIKSSTHESRPPHTSTDLSYLRFLPREQLGMSVWARKWTGNMERIKFKMGDWKEWALYLLKAA